MRYMLMMHAPRGTGEYQVGSWSPDDIKAHIAFMKDLNSELTEAGELVGAEGLAPPGEAQRRSRGEERRARRHRRTVPRGEGIPRRLLDRRRRDARARVRDRGEERRRRPAPAASRSTCRSKCAR